MIDVFTKFVVIILFSMMSPIFSSDTPSSNVAIFAGGCFWCLEPPYVNQEGVLSVYPGYIGGHTDQPTYEEVISGKTGHVEAVQVTFDPKVISYNVLLDIFWRQIDPTDPNGQFADQGSQYITAIFYNDDSQKELATSSKEDIISKNIFNKPIVTKILPASKFFIAEDYHQQYYKKNPDHYKRYRFFSGRESFLKKTWQDLNE